MCNLLDNCLDRLVNRSSIAKWGMAAFIALAAIATQAQPANDNFTNATVITGSSGTITGSNVGATAEAGEPDDAGNPGGPYHSIWYKWTSHITGTIQFNTEGSSFDTVMGVYQGSNVASLTLVAENDDVNFPSDLTSQVSFIVTNGGVYYISVDGGEGGETGAVTLNWQPVAAPSAGQFKFATTQSVLGQPGYIFSEDETYGVEDPFMTPNGARVRLTRTGGSAGLVHVSYTVTNAFYTNIFVTNFFGTNIYATNLTTGTNWTNVLVTNIAYTNFFANNANGGFTFCTIIGTNTTYGGTTITITNDDSGFSITNITNYSTPLPVPNPCHNTNFLGIATNSGSSNIIIFVTNVFCTNVFTTNLVPMATPGTDYQPSSGTVDFRDYQMGADIPVNLLDSGSQFNHIIMVVINSVTLDPNEDTNVIAPPTIAASSTNVFVESLSEEAMGITNDPCGSTNIIFNLDKAVYTCTRTVGGSGTATVWVVRTGYDPTASGSVSWRIDYGPNPNQLHSFGLQPGSDYAIPNPDGGAPASQPADFTSVTGTVTFGAFDFQPKPIQIPILDNNLVEFNDDLQIELFGNTAGVIGQLSTCTLTILFDRQPAGAIDRAYNPENNQNTSPPFNSNPGANKSAYACLVQPADGKAVIAGDFTAYDTWPRNSVARVNTDGSIDTTFLAPPNSGANGTVTCLAIDTNNLIYIGGAFTSFNGTNRYSIARLNTDGSLDATFNPGFGVNGAGASNGTVWAMAMQPDGRLIIAGNFISFNATNRNNIARLNTDGSLDLSFDPGIGPNGTINALALQANGAIVIGGEFSQVSGSPRQSVARLNSDGTLDTNFNPGAGTDANTAVYALAEQSNGQLLVGGSFNTFNLINSKSIVRLNTDGSIDSSFNPGTGADNAIYCISVQPDGGILIGGLFTSYNETRRIGVARLFTTGALDTSFMDTAYNQFAGVINTYYNPNYQPKNFIYCMGLQADGNIIIAGGFNNIGGGYVKNALNVQIPARDGFTPRQNFARLIGGTTGGPGNIGLGATNYNADEDGGNAFVTLTRSNGHLGVAGAALSATSPPAGPGAAVSNVDYTFNTNYAEPTYPSSYALTWQKADGIFGTNNIPIDDTGATYSAIPAAYVNIIETGLVNGNHSLNLGLSNPTSADVFFLGNENIPLGTALDVTTSAPMEIINNNAPHGTLSFSSATYTVNETATNAVITVNRTGGSAGQITVLALTVAGGTAVPGSTNDYLSVSNVLTFNDSITNQTFNVPLIDNGIAQSDRTVFLLLTNITGGGSAGLTNAVLTIINDNFAPGHLQFTSANYGINETGGSAVITVSRTGGSTGSISISCASSNGTATNGVNYSAATNILSWNAGDVSLKTFTVPVFHDGLVNSNLTVNLSLFNPVINGSVNNAALGIQSNAVLTITNVDFYGQPTLSASAYSVNENAGFVTITVNRLGGSAQTMTVNYATSDGTAFQNLNYTPVSGTLTFPPGVFSTNFIVPILDADANPPVPNGNTYFNVTLSSPTPTNGPIGGATLGNPSAATVTIIDNLTYNQPAGGVDTTFEGYFNNTVYSLGLQTNGQILAAGDFTLADGIARNRVARLNTDGSLDEKFGADLAGANDSIRALVIQSDGAILIGGLFASVDDVNNSSIARLNFDGSLDSTFNPGSGADSSVYAIAETWAGSPTNSANRRILIGGSFANYNGVSYPHLAQLTENGGADTTFNSTGANGTVYAIAVYSTNDAINGGKILIGGDFTQVNGVTRHHIARLNADGSLDASFNPGAGPNDSVRAIAIQVDGNIVIGGIFTTVGSTPLNYIARLTPNGLVDSAFDPGLGVNNAVTCLALQEDHKIVLGGSFTQAAGIANNLVTRNRLTRLNPDGSLDSAINFGSGANDFVASIVIQNDERLVIGGNFTQFDGINTPYIARLYGLTTPGPGYLTFTSAFYQVNENATNIVIPVQRVDGTSDANIGNVYVQFSTSDGTASSGTNYIGVTNELTFPVGEVFEYVTIPVINNSIVQSNLTVNLTLSNPTDAALGAQPMAVLTIVNDNSDVTFSSANYTVVKNDTTGEAAITILRNGSSVGTASVDVATTASGSAFPGIDYQPLSNTVVFADGQSEQQINIQIFTNNLAGSRTVGIALLNPTNTFVGSPGTATLTIQDNGTVAGSIGFAATNYFATDVVTNAVITLIRTNGTTGEVAVTCVANGGTATAGVDYAPTNVTVDFIDGQTNAFFTVPILYDSNAMPNLTVNLTLTNATGGAELLPPAAATLTLVSANTGFAFDSPAYFVDETNGSVTVQVDRIGATNGAFSVQYATTNGTATSGTNYSTASATLNFAPGETFQTFTIPILYDPQITGNLTFFVQLFNPSAPGQLVSPATTAITVVDDNTGLSLVTNSNSVPEYAGSIQIPVVRTGSSVGQVTVNYSTSDGSAVNGVGYYATNGVLTFQDGQSTNFFTVGIINNNIAPSNEYFNVFLSNPGSGTSLVSPTNEVITIIEDNSAFSFSSPTYTVAENGVAAQITVLRSGVTNTAVSVNFATANGTATNGVQYQATNGVLYFTNGQTSATFNVGIINANVTGGSETVNLSLSNPSPATNTSLISPNQAVLTIFNDDGSLIVPAGSYLLSGGSNNIIYPGDTVTMLLALRNSAGTNTTANFAATLLASNGVTAPSPSGPVTYGMLVTNGPSVSRQFQFTAVGTNGSQIAAILQMQDGTNNLGFAQFNFTLGLSTVTYSNTNYITINDDTAATPYPSAITVAALGGQISKVTTTVSNLAHTYASDVCILLVGPGGQPDLLMAQAGGAHVETNVTLTFDASSSNYLTTNTPVSGTYAPTDFSTAIPFPAPAPTGPYPTNYANLTGQNPNGTWSLYVYDDKVLDTGSINNGWSLTISSLNVLTPTVDLIVGLTASTNQVVAGSNITYTITVTNCGPAPATGVILTNVLPTGATLVFDSSSQGTGWVGIGSNNTFVCNLGSLATNVTATATIVITTPANGAGTSVTNTVTAVANETDAYTGDNTASLITPLSNPTAYLVVSLTDSPDPIIISNILTYTITVTNNGPATASNVLATNYLPPEVIITNYSAGGTVGTNLGFTTLTYGLGSIPSGGTNGFTIQVVPTAPGLITNIVGIGSTVLNPLQANDFASVKTQVMLVQLNMGLSGNSLTFSWSTAATGRVLQSTYSLNPPAWTNVNNSVSVSNGQYVVTVPLSGGAEFFRLGPAP